MLVLGQAFTRERERRGEKRSWRRPASSSERLYYLLFRVCSEGSNNVKTKTNCML